MRRRRASRIEANNRPSETGGDSPSVLKGVKGAPGVSLCARLSRGVQLNELPVLVPLVAHNSRLLLFRSLLFRVFHRSSFTTSGSGLLPSDPFKIRVLSYRLGRRRL